MNALTGHARSEPQPLKRWLDATLGFIYPEACQICGHEHATASEGFVCGHCSRKVRRIEPPFCKRCGLPFDGDLSGLSNARIARRWICVSARRVPSPPPKALCSRSSTATNINARFGSNRFLRSCWRAKPAPCLSRGCDISFPCHCIRPSSANANSTRPNVSPMPQQRTGIPSEQKAIAPRRTHPDPNSLTRQQRAANVARAFAVAPGPNCRVDAW